MKAIEDFYKARTDWFAIYSLSSGASSRGRETGSMSDLSMMKKYNAASPQMWIMTMAGEVLPFALFRSVAAPSDGKFKVIEYDMKGVTISSCQMSGSSGGDDAPMESLSVDFQKISIRYLTINVADGKFLEDSKGSWDVEGKKGAREGKMAVPSLKALCKKSINDSIFLFDQRSLQKLPRSILDDLDIGRISAESRVPLRGRRLLVSADPLKEGGHIKFKEIFVKQLTLEALRAAIAQKLQTKAAFQGIYLLGDTSLIEIENNEQVEDLAENTQLYVAL